MQELVKKLAGPSASQAPNQVLSQALGWLLLAALLVAAVGASLVVDPTPRGDQEATAYLQAESLARDGDLAYTQEDRERFLEKAAAADEGWPEDLQVRLASGGSAGSETAEPELRYYRPLPFALAAAPLALVAPERGMLLLNAALLVFLGWLLAYWLRAENPSSAPLWAVAVLAGTPLAAYARSAWPELLVAAALLAAYVILRWGALPSGPLPEIFVDLGSAALPAPAWLLAGILLGAAVAQEPYLAPVALAVAFAGRGLATPTRLAALALGAILVLGGLFLTDRLAVPDGNVFADDPSVGVLATDKVGQARTWAERAATASGVAVSDRLALEPSLVGWNLVYALVGRTGGVLLLALPLWILVATSGGVDRVVTAGAAVSLAAIVLLEPFDLLGGAEALGCRRLLPALPVLAAGVRMPARPAIAAAAAILGGVLTLPLWAHPLSHAGDLRQNAIVGPVAARLPVESTQRYLPTAAEVVTNDSIVRAVSANLDSGGRRSHFVLRPAGSPGRRASGELLIATAGELAYFDVEMRAGAAGRAGSEDAVEVGGATLQNLIFRPDGGTTYRFEPEKQGLARHRLWTGERSYRMFRMRLAVDQAGEAGVAFSVVPAVVPESPGS